MALVPLTLLPVVLTPLGAVYGVAAGALGLWFLSHALRLLRRRNDEAARGLFRVSLLHLMGVFTAMIVDLALGAGLA